MKEFGTYLRHAREAAGLTLEDLHDRTRISLKNLRLIESGDFPSIPQTYVRAFVREFARTVGLDEEEVIASYNEAAERDKGIPPPPAAIDSSNLLPRLDDTIEFVEPINRPPSHVEVEGKAEVESETFVPPVKKSSYIREGDAKAIDIRTTSMAERESTAEAKTQSPEAPTEKQPAAPPPSTLKSSAEKTDTGQAKPADSAQVPRPEKKGGQAPKESVPSAPTPQPGVTASEPRQKSAPPPPRKTAPDREAAPPQSAPPPPPPVITPADGGSEKRIIGMGLVIITMIVIAVYGIFFFSSGDDGDEVAAVDSTSIKASIEAGRFIDSSQYALTELDLAPEDTVTQPITPPEPVEAKQRVFAKEDSLVLEAFTSAPVWFSVKMDTLRTERGSLSSNEHRVWKARDYFVITLGDAGAVTFFLNGKEIGTLGDEGAVVKNLTLSRQHLNGN